jgi:hypothetical protein
MRRLATRPALAILAVQGSCLVLAACGGPSRSVAAYCSYFYGQGSQLRNRWIRSSQAAGGDPFAAMSSVFADLPEAANFLHQLSLRAPETIAPDVQALADALGQVSGHLGGAAADPLGALAGGLLKGLATGGAEQRVNAFTVQHCGGPPASKGASDP